jgi:hypothetical protein
VRKICQIHLQRKPPAAGGEANFFKTPSSSARAIKIRANLAKGSVFDSDHSLAHRQQRASAGVSELGQ